MLQDIAGRGLTHCAFLGWNTWGATPGVQHRLQWPSSAMSTGDRFSIFIELFSENRNENRQLDENRKWN